MESQPGKYLLNLNTSNKFFHNTGALKITDFTIVLRIRNALLHIYNKITSVERTRLNRGIK